MKSWREELTDRAPWRSFSALFAMGTVNPVHLNQSAEEMIILLREIIRSRGERINRAYDTLKRLLKFAYLMIKLTLRNWIFFIIPNYCVRHPINQLKLAIVSQILLNLKEFYKNLMIAINPLSFSLVYIADVCGNLSCKSAHNWRDNAMCRYIRETSAVFGGGKWLKYKIGKWMDLDISIIFRVCYKKRKYRFSWWMRDWIGELDII